MTRLTLLAGAAGAVVTRQAFLRAVRAKLERDVAALNRGDYAPLLSGYHDDAVLRFVDGDHRWAGTHAGKPAIERFLQMFVAAGIQGELKDLLIEGPPWALRFVVRFDDWSLDPDTGLQRYANRTCLYLRTRWGRIVEHEDFYEDTARIPAFDALLREREAVAVG